MTMIPFKRVPQYSQIFNSQARQTKRLEYVNNKNVKHEKNCQCHVNGDSQNVFLLNLRHFYPLELKR